MHHRIAALLPPSLRCIPCKSIRWRGLMAALLNLLHKLVKRITLKYNRVKVYTGIDKYDK